MLGCMPFFAFSQEVMNVYKDNSVTNIPIDSVSQMSFSSTLLKVEKTPTSSLYSVTTLDSITFTDQPGKYPRKTYANPVLTKSMPDPTVMRASDGYYYLYATEDTYNMPIMRSTDLVNWTFMGTVFTKDTRPNFEPGGGLWAPDINCIDGKYVIYYSMSVWGGQMTCGIGVATADKPEGPFKDAKMLFRSTGEGGIGVQNSIDPFYIEENGRKYLFWGSFSGIYGVELTADGLSVKSAANKQKVAGNWFEASYIYKKNGYYYLFASIGSCCEGAKSTYEVVVARSKSLFGPYKNRAGGNMLDNKFEYFIRKNTRFVGNGHNSEIVQDDEGNEWILYHGYDVLDEKGRRLFLDEVKWTEDGWPYIKGGSPSLKAEAPVIFNKK